MRVLNLLLALHEGTKLESQSSGRNGLSKRMFVRTYEINRIGRFYDDVKRDDVHIDLVLKTYLARKVYFNEKKARDKYQLDNRYELEERFTAGLWRIYCAEVYGEPMPELPLPDSYSELQRIFDYPQQYLDFDLYDTVKAAVIHNQIVESEFCKSMRDFDAFCSLPGDVGWTSVQHGAMLVDGRDEAPVRLLQVALGMFRYEYLGCPEPYKNFWKERAYLAMNKAVALLESTYILRFRNATMYEIYPMPSRFTPVDSFVWNIKRT